MESRSFPAHEWLSDTLRDHLQPEMGCINIKIWGRKFKETYGQPQREESLCLHISTKTSHSPLKEWRTLMSMQYNSPFENPHNWLPSKILVAHYFTSQIHQILFSAMLNVPSTYLPTVHLPQFPVAYCTNQLPWPSIQFIFFNGLHFRLCGCVISYNKTEFFKMFIISKVQNGQKY
jgi:hypothetical protein